MLPVLLDLHGFTVFREPTRIDFRDADFFALVGPTGSGKSTVIDAMCFALYGSVPRWDKRNVVSPALAPTTARGTVRLVFDMAGHRYVVARELRRLPGGNVTVRNARLERLTDAAGLGEEGEESESMAADSAVSAEVERLLGLSFEHFITCVVLPQGDFAQFLHATAGERQKILVRLLGLDEYGRIAQAANVAATDAETRADQIMLQLADYADATEETEAALAAAGAALEALADPTASATGTIRHLVGSAAEAAAARDRLAGEGARLADVRVPDGAGDVAAAVATATRSARAADDALEQAERDDDAAQRAARTAPAHAALEEVIRAWKMLDDREARLPDLVEAHTRAAARRAEQDAADERARAALDEAEAAKARADRDDLAAALRPHLHAGADCPVCAQPVAVLPPPLPDADVSAAARALRGAQQAASAAGKECAQAAGDERVALGAIEGARREIAGIRQQLADAPSKTDAQAALGAAERLRMAAEQSAERVRALRARARESAAAREEANLAARAAHEQLGTVRDGLVGLGAPALPHEDLAAGWELLVSWAESAAAARAEALVAADRIAADAGRALDDARGELVAGLGEAGIPLPAGTGRAVEDVAEAALAAATSAAGAALERMRERRATAQRLRARRDEAARRATVARRLGVLLDARHFQRWLAAEALDILVVDASATLSELSGEQYELAHDKGEFLIVDHSDADSRRPVKTLSGGETFQASLALALALSEHLSSLAAAGTARLDSIFLDEGFGSLDEATLDVVAATLENLAGKKDRMVGIVTHVRALAERVPLRFTVARTGATATVRREQV